MDKNYRQKEYLNRDRSSFSHIEKRIIRGINEGNLINVYQVSYCKNR